MPYAKREDKLAYNKIYFELNKEKIRAQNRAYHLANRESRNKRRKEHWLRNRDEYLRRYKIYREEHKAELNEYNRIYRAKHREEINAKIREYTKSERAHERNHKQRTNRRALEHGLTISGKRHTREEWMSLVSSVGGKCFVCGIVCKTHPRLQADSLTKDHIVPLKYGGSDDISNIQVLCMACNARKGDSYEKKN